MKDVLWGEGETRRNKGKTKQKSKTIEDYHRSLSSFNYASYGDTRNLILQDAFIGTFPSTFSPRFSPNCLQKQSSFFLLYTTSTTCTHCYSLFSSSSSSSSLFCCFFSFSFFLRSFPFFFSLFLFPPSFPFLSLLLLFLLPSSSSRHVLPIRFLRLHHLHFSFSF